ncbi:MAG: radical SAM protein [Anaeromyxobacter sp.]
MTFVTSPDDCNLGCDMCPCGLDRAARAAAGLPPRPPRPRRMAPGLALEVLGERRGSPLSQVIPSTMGEPLLWSGLDDLLEGCRAAGAALNLTTNGTWPGRGPDAWAAALLPVACDVKISWNGATAATAEALMPGLSFAAAVEGVRRVAAARDRQAAAGGPRPTLSFQVTAQEANLAELPELVRLAAALGVDRVKVNQLQVRWPALAARSLRRSPEAIRRWNAAVPALQAAAAAGPRPVRLQHVEPLRPDPTAPAPLGPCPFLGQEAWIHWDGRLAPCPHPAAAGGALGELGSVAERPLGELWAAPAYRSLLERWPDLEPCRSCPFRRPGGA